MVEVINMIINGRTQGKEFHQLHNHGDIKIKKRHDDIGLHERPCKYNKKDQIK